MLKCELKIVDIKILIQNSEFFVVLKDFVIMEPTKPMQALGHPRTWGEKLHKEEEVVANQLGLIKYKRPCTWCCGTVLD